VAPEILAEAAAAASATIAVSDYLPLLVYFWLAGVCVLVMRSIGGWVVVQRVKRRSWRPVDPVWQDRFARLLNALGMTHAVSLRQSALAEVPAVIGWLSPVVLLPGSALTGLTPQQLEALLAHELAHIRRHDYLVNLLQTAVETLLFYHPAVWWIGRRIRAERENCCDDVAVEVCGDALAYARALARLEQLRSGLPQLAMASNHGSLLNRIQRLLAAKSAAGSAGNLPRGAAERLSGWHGALPALLCVAALWIAPLVPVQGGFSQQAPADPAPVAPATPPAAPRPVLTAPPPAPVAPHASPVAVPEPLPATPSAAPVAAPRPVPAAPAVPHPAPVVAPLPVPAPSPTPAAARAKPVLVAAVREGIRDGVLAGVREGIAEGVVGGVAAGVTEGLVGGILAGVRGGVAGGVLAGVGEGVEGGVREDVREGVRGAVEGTVRAGVRYGFTLATAYAVQAQAAGDAAAKPATETKQGGFIDGLAAAGYRDLSADDLIRLKIHGVTPEFARQIQAAGFQPTAEDLVKLRIHGVTPEFIAESKAAGLNLSMEELRKFRIHGVNMAAVAEMGTLGYKLSSDQMVKMHIHGLTPALARELKQAGFGDPSFEQLLKMQIHGVTPEFAAAVKQAGLAELNLEQLIKFRIHGVEPEQIREIRELGFADLSAKDVIALRIHGVTPAHIREAQRHGFKDLSLDKIIKLKQLGILSDGSFI
jgi:Zn-dependent protease with chaperone function